MDTKINEWLQTYKPIFEIAKTEEIHSERVSENVKNLALQRTGFENLPMKYITDRGWHRQYQYMLLLKSESETDNQKSVNLDWLDDFSDWFVKQKEEKNLPILNDNKKVTDVSCANALTYEENEDGSISVYALQIYFNVRKAE
ncbi:MAG: hypothetical protein HFJ12_01585 [Bacilli bacterium]|nr:hypothetical protein [Bacilli bacterium]